MVAADDLAVLVIDNPVNLICSIIIMLPLGLMALHQP
jgi:hypothetical protein